MVCVRDVFDFSFFFACVVCVPLFMCVLLCVCVSKSDEPLDDDAMMEVDDALAAAFKLHLNRRPPKKQKKGFTLLIVN